MIRHEYLVERQAYRSSERALPPGVALRPPVDADRPELAALMMDAYVGTIDYDGETLEQAVEEVDGAFSNEALVGLSRVAIKDGTIVSALLVSLVESDAVVGYVMTRAAAKVQGYATVLLDECAAAIWDAGYDRIRAWITEGNTPSERVFRRAGFHVVGTTATDSAGEARV
jgi:RimJ/RimL family protein N-acetyltransferase